MPSTTRIILAALLAVGVGLMPVQRALAASESSEVAAPPESDSGTSGASQALLGAAAAIAVTGFVISTVARPTYEAYDPDTGEYEEREVDVNATPFYLAAGGLLVFAALANMLGSPDKPGEDHGLSSTGGTSFAQGSNSVFIGPAIAADRIGLAVGIRF